MNLENLSHLAKILTHEQRLLELLALQVPMASIVALCLVFLEDFDCETVGMMIHSFLAEGIMRIAFSTLR